MASFSIMSSCNVLLFLTVFFSLHFLLVQSVKFEVGDDNGWVVPSSKNDQTFNQWASKHRFLVGDTIHFKYNKDSVLVVSEEEYDRCRSVHPLFFSNNGDTDFKFDNPDLYYFISGVSGHCERGVKMIIKVLDIENTPPGGTNGTAPVDPNHKSGVALKDGSTSLLVGLQFVMLFFSGFMFS
ncbi:hypothetical protein IFM89_033961 [Coptis chinensis]|uniref:Phytocyanin domain-containing protein n=1 Tax=Coptis chinensis TaxID=261450 RepID=A0A835HLN4_9MAGN|nr:hypothetical protein IFM89_033961 [Coptis chinensis]